MMTTAILVCMISLNKFFMVVPKLQDGYMPRRGKIVNAEVVLLNFFIKDLFMT